MQTDINNVEGEEELYNNEDVIVTPSWLIIGNTSFAVRYIQKLVLKVAKPPRAAAGAVFLFALLLMLLQLYRIISESSYPALNWILLILCLVLMLVSSYYAFVVPVRYRLDVFIATETKPLHIFRSTKADMEKLHEELRRTMMWHRGDAESLRLNDIGDDKSI